MPCRLWQTPDCKVSGQYQPYWISSTCQAMVSIPGKCFCNAIREQVFLQGSLIQDGPWWDIGQQSLQPLFYRRTCGSFTASISHEKAYSGAASLQVTGDVCLWDDALFALRSFAAFAKSSALFQLVICMHHHGALERGLPSVTGNVAGFFSAWP